MGAEETQSDEQEEDRSEEKPFDLANRKNDYVVSALNSALGAVPFAGSLLGEIVGHIVPEQRIDRIAKFAETLEERLSGMEEAFVRSKLTDENFTDLLEEGLYQAARSLTDERRKYLASLIAGSLDEKRISFIESKHLLKILGEINDIEVIWLQSYQESTSPGYGEFRGRHKEVLKRIIAGARFPQDVLDKKALQDSYKEHLASLGLLNAEFKTDPQTEELKLDMRGALEVQSYRITLLGRLLLRQIGLELLS